MRSHELEGMALGLIAEGKESLAAGETVSALREPCTNTFSYRRALHDLALEVWPGCDANLKAAEYSFYRRASFNAAARVRKYADEMESASSCTGDPPHRHDWSDDR
jgi:fructose-bisphosphate aldolase class 1